MKRLVVLSILVLLQACGSNAIRVQTEVKEVYIVPPVELIVPVFWPEDPRQNDGTVTPGDLLQYILGLQTQLNIQDDNNDILLRWIEQSLSQQEE